MRKKPIGDCIQGKRHYWEPIYKRRVDWDKRYFLYGICRHCKRVETGERLMRLLNERTG